MHPRPEPSRSGTVVLDIGGDVGAAAIYVPASLAGEEIEIRAVGAAWDGTHVEVRERQLPDSTVWAALFPALTHGEYEIRLRGHVKTSAVGSFTVSGGKVENVNFEP